MTAQTRREFIETFGAALAAILGTGLLSAGCLPVSCYTPAPATLPPSNSAERRHRAWGTVRQHWLGMAQVSPYYLELRSSGHRQALDQLVAAHEVDAAVADEMQRAYDAAALYYRNHYLDTLGTPESAYLASTPSPCYESPELERPRAALAQQSAALTEMADSGTLNADSVAQAQAALEQEMALLELVAACDTLSASAHRATEDGLVAQFDAHSLDAPPEAMQAARILVTLLARGELP